MATSQKRSRKTTTKWNLFFGYFGFAYAIVLGIFFVPLYLRFIPADQYGAWLASGNILFWLSATDLGLATVIMQRVGASYGRDDLAETGAFASSGFFLCSGFAIAIVALGGVLAVFLPGLLNLTVGFSVEDLQGAFFVAVLGTSLSLLGFSVSAANQGLQGSFGVGLAGVISQFASMIVTLVGVLVGLGLYALALGILARGSTLFLGNIMYFLWRKRSETIPLRFQKYHLRDLTGLLGFSSLGKLGYALSEQTDAFLLTRFIGPEATLTYALTRKGTSIANIALLRPGNAFSPTVSHLVGEELWERARAVLCRLLCFLVWGAGAAAAGFLALNSDFVALWVGAEFYAGFEVNLAIVVTLLIAAPLRNMAVLCTAMGDIKRISLVALVRGIATVIYMLVGLELFGILGVAVAPIIGLITVTALFVPRAFLKLLGMEGDQTWQIVREFCLAAAIGLLVGNLSPLFPDPTWSVFAVNCIAVLAYYGILLSVFSRYFRKEVRAMIVGIRSAYIP